MPQNHHHSTRNDYESDQYFYHTDLPGAIGIGSGSLITDRYGDVDLADIVISSVTTPGAGGLVDVKYSFGVRITGLNKNTSQTIIDVGTGALGNLSAAKAYNSVAPFYKNGFERGMIYTIINVPTSVLGAGTYKAISNKRR